MKSLSFRRHRFLAEVIRQAVWLYFRFCLRLRDVEEMLAARGRGQPRDDPMLDVEGFRLGAVALSDLAQ